MTGVQTCALPIFNSDQKFTKKTSKEIFFSEITREAILNYIHKEIPYKCVVKTDHIKNSKSVTIQQSIIVKTEAHKKILLGKNGAMIKKIGTYSRLEIEKILKKKINLFLKIKLAKVS